MGPTTPKTPLFPLALKWAVTIPTGLSSGQLSSSPNNTSKGSVKFTLSKEVRVFFELPPKSE